MDLIRISADLEITITEPVISCITEDELKELWGICQKICQRYIEENS